MACKEDLLVVVVEDDEDMRVALLGALRALGIDARGFSDPRGLLEAIFQLDVDCLVLDVGLPGRTGFDLYAEVGASRKHLPVVFITGRDDVGWRATAKSMRGEYLLKPFSGIALREAIMRAVR